MIGSYKLKPLGVLLLWLLAAAPCWAEPQTFDFHAPAAAADNAATAALMRDLAQRILPVYEEQDPERYLENLSALQLAAGDYESAYDTRKSLRERRQSTDAGRLADRDVPLDLYAQAKAAETAGGASFTQAFRHSFEDVVPRLDDGDAYAIAARLEASPALLQSALQQSLDRLRGKYSINLEQALDLIQAYVAFAAYHSFGPLIGALGSEDGRRRYLTDDDVLIKAGGGAELHVRVVRPKNPSKALPALFKFALSGGHDDDAEASAAHGYVGVAAYPARPDQRRGGFVPFERDGENARAVIGWIARQPWSDGRVGMYGAGYSGFAAWAAARHLPRALKAIATSDAMAPGIDFPTQGRIFRSDALRWAAGNAPGKDESAASDDAQWRAIDQTWYRSGKRFRDLDRLLKKPRPSRVFHRWLNHPSYDRYWQKMIPFGRQFARIGIPVLAITGYYADGEPGALYYFTQHFRYKPDADHTLLIGPYDDSAARGSPPAMLRGAAVDSAALVDLQQLRYEWFDHVLKGAAEPPLLKDRVNYELMGANQWQHAASIEAMANGALRFYLDAKVDDKASADFHRLAQSRPANAGPVSLNVDFADRSDAAAPLPTLIAGKRPEADHDLKFVSEPLPQPTQIAGPLSGQLDFKVNKMDMDLNLTLFELLPDGDYLQLSDPCEFRASYVRDRVHRQLLRAGERQRLIFRCERIISRKIQADSRVLLLLGINKRPDREINYGSSKDVGEESVKDGRIPMKIQWYGGSYVDVPVRRPPPSPSDERNGPPKHLN